MLAEMFIAFFRAFEGSVSRMRTPVISVLRFLSGNQLGRRNAMPHDVQKRSSGLRHSHLPTPVIVEPGDDPAGGFALVDHEYKADRAGIDVEIGRIDRRLAEVERITGSISLYAR